MPPDNELFIRLDAYVDPGLLAEGVDRAALAAPLAIGEAIESLSSWPRSEGVKELTAAFGEKPVAVIFSNYFYDVYEKMEVLRRDLGYDILLIERTPKPAIHDKYGVLRANLVDVYHFLEQRRRHDNILYFSVHPVWRLVILALLRQRFPELRILLYMYDWLNLFCPRRHRQILQRFLSLPDRCIDSEYDALERILDGEIVNGILYKDGGPEFHVLAACPLPRFFCPAALPRSLFQPVAIPASQKKTVYLGKLFSDTDFVSELFVDAFLTTIWERVAAMGYSVDAYYVRSTEATVRIYQDCFRQNQHVRLIPGRPLDVLLPDIAGQYGWGYLLNNYGGNYDVIRGHVEAALPARIFTFLALGIPALVSAELTYTAQFVTEHNIGCAVPFSEIDRLDDILSGIDHTGMMRSLVEVRETYSFDRMKEGFVRFIRAVAENEWKAGLP
ncbi:MAG: hypothetical protein ACOY3Z_02200 [Thermodesulfobacteriota bacterium]